jgi:hypothetical protein
MSASNYSRQYEAPIKPETWTGEAGRFHRMLIDVLDDIYLKYGRIDEKMLATSLVRKLNSPPDGIVNGTELVVTKDEVYIETPKFAVNVSGASGDMTLDENGLSAKVVTSPSVRPMYYGASSLSVREGESDGINVFSTLSEVFSRLNGKYMAYPVTIDVYSAQTEGSAVLEYTDGAPITIRRADSLTKNPALNVQVTIESVRNIVNIEKVDIGYTSGGNTFTITNSGCVIARNSNFVALSGVHAVLVERSAAEFYTCGFFNATCGVYCQRMAHVYIEGCKGSGLKYGIAAQYGSRASGASSIPPGSTSATQVTSDSEYRGTTTTATGTSPFAPATTNTVELTLTNTRTYGGGWYNSSVPKVSQGASGNTKFRGYMWFDFSPIAGQTIKQAALKLFRQAGVGKSDYVDVYIGAAKVAGPGNAIEASAEYGKVGVAAQNEKVQIPVPVEAMQAIADGTYNALFLYSNETKDYAAFDGIGEGNPPRLAVLY